MVSKEDDTRPILVSMCQYVVLVHFVITDMPELPPVGDTGDEQAAMGGQHSMLCHFTGQLAGAWCLQMLKLAV